MRLDTVRRLDELERSQAVDLWVAAWAATMPEIDFEARRPWFSARLDVLMGGGADLVVCRREEGGRLAGFITVHPATGETDQLAVDRAAQGRGVARLLLDEAKRRSPKGLRLSVNAANARARGLYEWAGFRNTGNGVNPRSGLPVLTMRWTPTD